MAWTLGNFFGIPVRLHFTMILVPFLTYSWMPLKTSVAVLAWLSLVVLLFGSVLLHEFGHALTARRYGIRTQDIVLTPLGGMARVVSMPANPRQEIAIAIAGPIVSLSLAGIAFLASYPLGLIPMVPGVLFDVVLILFWTNLMLALFNLVPALPMDGGRVLRGILALRRDHLAATRIAARVGRVLAVSGIVLALLYGNITLGLIAVFVYIAAGSEVRMAEYRAFEAEMRRQGASAGPFPFGGMPRGWTWTARTGTGAKSAAQSHGGRPADAGRLDSDGEWLRENDRAGAEAIQVTGKAEVVGRKDPRG